MQPTPLRRWPRLALPLLIALALLAPALSPARTSAVGAAQASQLKNINTQLAGSDNPLADSGSMSPDYNQQVAQIGRTIFFSADDGTHGSGLWKSDGTTAGTTLVKSGNISPSSAPVAVGSTLFFANGFSGTQLSKSDGTTNGTVKINVSAPGGVVVDFANLTAVGNTLFFSAKDQTHGNELWRSDGTDAGTVMVKDIHLNWDYSSVTPYPYGSSPSHLTVMDGTLFFSANDGSTGSELWKSDGTEAGTTLVKDIRPGTLNGWGYNSSPSDLVVLGSMLFFSADDGIHGRELWKSDGTEAGTTLVKDIVPGATGSSPSAKTTLGGALFFRAGDSAGMVELWRSDGSAAGTTLVKHIDFAGGASYPAMKKLTVVGNTLYFTAPGFPDGLWKSDGTTAGTTLLKLTSSVYIIDASMTAVGNTLFFVYNGELWQSDGSADGTTMVQNINPSANSNPGNLTLTPAGLFFSADDGLTGREPWLLPITASLASSNGASGAPGSDFAFTAGGFPAGAAVTISVTPPAPQGASVAAVGDAYVVGTVTADAGGAVSFAVRLNSVAQAGAYTVTASAGALSASAQVTVSAAAPLLSAPDGVPVLHGLPSLFLPMIRR